MEKTTVKRISLALLLGLVAICLCALCACQNAQQSDGKIHVKDTQGTEFTFDEPVKKVVSTHNPTLNHIVILGNGTTKYLAGFGNKDKANNLYKEVLDDWDTITVIGSNGNPVNKETIIKLHPDLAIVSENLAAMKDKDYEGTGVDTFVALPEKESLESIKYSSKLLGKLFGEDERAENICKGFDEAVNSVTDAVKDVKDEEKPSVLFMGTQKYKVATSDMIQTELIEKAGGKNAAKGQFDSGFFASADAEAIVKMNPDVIYFPNYAKFSVEDILNDEKLQSVNAIKNKKVFKFPCNLEPWDYPTPATCCGLAWVANNLHPELYSHDKLVQLAQNYYKLLYNKDFSAEKLGI